jgi:prepilin-type N-terminal cleavage/methylation domain-containing protein
VISSPTPHRIVGHKSAFTLIEMVVVIAILVTLMTAGVSLLHNTAAQSRRAATDSLTALVAQARTYAITSRCEIVLAIAEPTDLPSSDGRYQLGLFKLSTPLTAAAAVTGELIQRWQSLDNGIVLLTGEIAGLPNLMDQDKLKITYGGSKNINIKVHALIFNSRGGIRYPTGSSPLALRLAEGRYRDGIATPNKHAGTTHITENRLKIGRLTARLYPID